MDETVANTKIELTPIGYFKSSQVHPYEAGRQPDSHHATGVIELLPGQNFEQATTGLEGCKKIWVIFAFHRNDHWNPMVLPPRGRNTKIGVFATRSPYRPNPVGMSCVDVVSIEKLNITVAGADILDGSPILDIKPYVAYADSFPEVEPDWLNEAEKYSVEFSVAAEKALVYLQAMGVENLRGFLQHQLEFEPTNGKKKRVKDLSENEFIIAYRTWRAVFTVTENSVTVLRIESGYSTKDLKNSDDTYQDKELHRDFLKQTF
ncbi:tRNA (N6-threonylcarbamoyladenosine(37)-N6)-methyltransferase TrmO [Bdellovibrio sp. HCB288]|uniref:tRNA (N6-threonylcarbamoyladenosine(37)-N6)-methyltransferase TrmO n=1 Tax=Bdellovibrio sp. HCB288 TaxID=3394355 RepID=UPI0039B646F0